MARGLDHLIHTVRDLDAAAEFYRRLGFTISARNRHPWGTHNRIIQLDGFFLELLTIGEPALLQQQAAADEGLATRFGVFHREFLQRGEGFSMLILQSQAIEEDVAQLAAAGIGASPPLTFSRVATVPDGTRTNVGFTLGFARDALSPQTGFALMQQRNATVFWNAALQSHANRARDVAGVVLVAENPADHHVFLTAFTGQRELHSTSMGVVARTPRGVVEIIEPTGFRDRFGLTVERSHAGTMLAGIRIIVSSLDQLAEALAASEVAFDRRRNSVVTGAFGAAIIFEQAAKP